MPLDACPPMLSPDQAQARLEACVGAEEARLMRTCFGAFLALALPGGAAVATGRGVLLAIGTGLGLGVLGAEAWRWRRRPVETHSRQVRAALGHWFDAQPEPGVAARAVARDERLDREIQAMAGDYAKALEQAGYVPGDRARR